MKLLKTTIVRKCSPMTPSSLPVVVVDKTLRSSEAEGTEGTSDTSDLAQEDNNNHRTVAPKLHQKKSCMKVKTQQESLLQVFSKTTQPAATTINNNHDCCCCRAAAEEAARKRQQHKQARRVRFLTVETRLYPIILSDHPSVSSGPPIGLGWKVSGNYKETVDSHQSRHCPHPNCNEAPPSSNLSDMFLSSWKRERMLLLKGYSHQDLRQAEKQAQVIQTRRQRNSQSLPIWLLPIVGWLVTAPPSSSSPRASKRQGRVRTPTAAYKTISTAHNHQHQRRRQRQPQSWRMSPPGLVPLSSRKNRPTATTTDTSKQSQQQSAPANQS